jgi:hypothetical protein
MDEVTRTIRYHAGPDAGAPLAGTLAQFLRDEGVHVDWTPPSGVQHRGLGADATQVVINLVSTGTVAIGAAVERFRALVPRGKVEIEGEPDGGLLDEQ